MSLNECLINLIAEKDGVKPEEVTGDYIHKQREKIIYPNMRFNLGPNYTLCGIKSFTLDQLNRIESIVSELMQHVS